SYVPNYRMMKLVKNLSKNYRLVIFSGNVKERIEYLEKRYHFLKYFDETVFSFDYNINKQKLDFYYELLAHIDCKPEEAILIDDSWDNIRRAKKVGLNGVYFLYTKQLLKTLKKFGIKIKL
ncbi:MAG: HAD-IA family hydrolase, partial [Candidatus Lokiarchaeota archaeon]|nr:HAD-IA family hydrolase [Candidatus Lokiarchaeota archaeon]